MARQEDEAAFLRHINVIYTLMSVMATQYDLLIYKLTRTCSTSGNLSFAGELFVLFAWQPVKK